MLANGENNVFLFVNVDCCGWFPEAQQRAAKERQRFDWNQKYQGGSFPGAEGRTGNEAARANRRSTFLLKHFTKGFPRSGKQRKKFEKGEAIP